MKEQNEGGVINIVLSKDEVEMLYAEGEIQKLLPGRKLINIRIINKKKGD